MSAARKPGVSYTRFSDPYRQSKGDSQDRQDRMFQDFCQRHTLTPSAEVFADRGRSGYKDEHRKKGKLGQLVAKAKEGCFDPGTVIVVEAWDRLGRLRPDKQTELVAELLRTGVSIGICRLDDIFTEDDFGTHKWTTLAVFIQLAYQESKQKSERVSASWETRRKKARSSGALVTNRLPAWLELVNGTVRLIPDRAAVLKRIFQLAADGYGHTRIVRTLTKEGVSAFGEMVVNEGRSRSQFSGHWTRPYVALILNDRRVVGEFQPHKLDGSAEGPPIAAYYPAAVTEEDWLLARAGQEQRDNRVSTGRQRAARQSKYVNVFRSILIHARDGQGFLLHNKGTAAKPELLLINTNGNEGRGRCYTFPYHVFETAVLGLLREVDPRDVLPRKEETPNRAEVLQAKLDRVRHDVAQFKEDLAEGYSKALTTVLRERENEEAQLAEQLQEELARAAQPAESAWQELPGLVDMIRSAEDPDSVRLKLRVVLRRLIDEALVLIVRRASFQLCAVQVFFTGGKRRDYFILNQPAAFRRKGGWNVRSLSTVVQAGDLDLRSPEHADRLEAALLAAELPID